MTGPEKRLTEAGRVRMIEKILVSHDREDWEFDRFTRLARTTLRVPICLVSLVTSDRQVFAGACGLPPELATLRQTPLSHSICQHAVARRSMLVIGDTLADPVIREVPSVGKYGIRAYLGCPLMTEDGTVLGSFCVIDHVARKWTTQEMDLVRDFAALVVEKIDGKMREERHQSAFDVVIHDLKSPLSGMLMASALLNEQAGDFPERVRPLLEAVTEEGAKALRMVNVLARENHMESVDVCADPQPVLRGVVERLAAMAGAKSITVRSDFSSCEALATGPWVIEQVLENLLENAIKYSPPGSTIRVWSETAGRVGHFSVKDEGPGFSEDDRKRMFRRYTRLSAVPTADEPSTGLGLSIVKRLIDLHGGRIDLVSEVSCGANFRVTFPIVRDGH